MDDDATVRHDTIRWRWCGVDATRVTGAWRFADKSICDCVNMLLRFRAGNDSASENTNAKYSHECYVHIDLYVYRHVELGRRSVASNVIEYYYGNVGAYVRAILCERKVYILIVGIVTYIYFCLCVSKSNWWCKNGTRRTGNLYEDGKRRSGRNHEANSSTTHTHTHQIPERIGIMIAAV